MIAKHCPRLEQLILDDIPTLEVIEHAPIGLVAYLSPGQFNQLRSLSARQCPNLQRVKLYTTSLESCNLTGSHEKILLETCACPKTVSVKGCEISFRPKNLKEATRIAQNAGVLVMHLDLSLTGIINGDIDPGYVLKYFPNLRSLNLYGNEAVTDESLLFISVDWELQTLNLEGCSLITDEGLKFFALIRHNLRALNLNGCNLLTDRGLGDVVQTCHDLIALNLEWCSLITDLGMQAIAQNCSKLRNLSLVGCSLITDEGIAQIAQRCPDLEDFDLNFCDQITDAALAAVAQHCHNLRNFNLSKCTRVTARGVTAVVQSCPNLQDLDLYGCELITDVELAAIGQYRLENLRIRK